MDDLDAFFDDVQEAEEKAVEEPPKKKPKVLGVLVAAAAAGSNTTTTSSSNHKAATPSTEPLAPSSKPIAPPPKPVAPVKNNNNANNNNNNDDNTQKKQHKNKRLFRIFVGNLGPDVQHDSQLLQHFAKHYPSVQHANLIRTPRDGVSKGYGFVSFGDALEFAKALRHMDQTWLGSRPIRLKKSTHNNHHNNHHQK